MRRVFVKVKQRNMIYPSLQGYINRYMFSCRLFSSSLWLSKDFKISSKIDQGVKRKYKRKMLHQRSLQHYKLSSKIKYPFNNDLVTYRYFNYKFFFKYFGGSLLPFFSDTVLSKYLNTNKKVDLSSIAAVSFSLYKRLENHFGYFYFLAASKNTFK